jgi:hypothetical protein
MRVPPKRLRDDLLQLRFDFVDGLARREAGSVGDPEDMRVDGESLLAERSVQNDVRGLAPDAGKRLQLVARARDLRSMLVDQCLAQRDDVLCLGVEQADRLDRLTQGNFAEIDHLLRCLDAGEQRSHRDVDAGVGCLGRKHDGDEQLVWIARLELGRGRWVRLREPPEEFENLIALHNAPITSRIE